VDFLYEKLNNMPCPDFSAGIDLHELQMHAYPQDQEYEMKMVDPMHQEMKVTENMSYYPTILSPPDSPSNGNLRLSPTSAGQSYNQKSMNQWNGMRGRSDSVVWPAMEQSSYQEQASYPHSRSMSLPHVMQPVNDYIMAPVSDYHMGHSRKNSTSSTTSEKTFSCSHQGCDRTFSRIQNLRSHMRCHLVTTPHNCKTCGLGFRRTTDLQRHIRTMHTPNDQKPWACSKCPKRFGRSDALKRHMASRSKDHGCPGGPDMELLHRLEEQKRLKSAKMALATVAEASY